MFQDIQIRIGIPLFCLTALLSGCGEKIDVRQTETTNGLVYKLHDNEPFSGTVTDVHVYQGFGCIAEFKKGVLHGAVNCTYDNGNKAIESHWAEGKRDEAKRLLGSLLKIAEEKGSWGGGWRSQAKLQYHRLARDLGVEIIDEAGLLAMIGDAAE